MDSVLAGSDEEAEEDAVISQVLDEIGIEVTSKVSVSIATHVIAAYSCLQRKLPLTLQLLLLAQHHVTRLLQILKLGLLNCIVHDYYTDYQKIIYKCSSILPVSCFN